MPRKKDKLDLLMMEPLSAAKAGVEAVGGTLSRIFYKPTPGRTPGIKAEEIAAQQAAEPVSVMCIDYGPGRVAERDVDDLAKFLDEPRPADTVVRWLDIRGLGDPTVIQAMASHYEIHPLAIEDVLHVPQRPKLEVFNVQNSPRIPIFIISQMARLIEGRLDTEQVSLFASRDTIITLQQKEGDVWQPIRDRINRDTSRLRASDGSYLVYALLDAIVDHHFPVLEQYGLILEDMEQQIFEKPSQQTINRLHRIKRQLVLLRRNIWPMRELVGSLERDTDDMFSIKTKPFLRDAYDHVVQVLDILETYREVASGLGDSYMTAVSNRMNDVMKVLAIISTIFIPISFLAGVFGMNFEQIPGLHQPLAFAMFCVVCVAITVTMLIFFRLKKWI